MPRENSPAEGVFCLRNQVAKTTEEHLGCPYCFGTARDVMEAGERRRFCDYDPKHDPLLFGFPEGGERDRR